MPTITLRSLIESSEYLARRFELANLFGSWSVSNNEVATISVPYNSTTYLPAATTYILSADPLATIVVGWTVGSGITEINLNQFTAVCPPTSSNPYIRNTATSSTTNPVPVKLVAIS